MAVLRLRINLEGLLAIIKIFFIVFVESDKDNSTQTSIITHSLYYLSIRPLGLCAYGRESVLIDVVLWFIASIIISIGINDLHHYL